VGSDVKLGKKIFIKNSGRDEYWLQDKIYQSPNILGLGDLVVVSKEKKQSTGGRLDILLKDPQDNSMYEIEIMLGETDPSHIIRSIEYWDIEKRRYPQRQHFSVLVAESFNKRYFNVIQLLGLNIPMIAIQADLIDVEGQQILNFTKIMDTYEEPEEEEVIMPASETSWSDNAKWTLDIARDILENLLELDRELSLKFTQSYINIVKNGKNLYYFAQKASPKCYFWFKERDNVRIEAIRKLLDDRNFSYNYNKYNEFVLTIDSKLAEINIEVFKIIHDMKYKSFISEDEM
jgi:hypothetical protein